VIFLTVRIIIHKKFVPPGQTLNQNFTRRFWNSTESTQNDDRTKTGSFTMTMCWCTLLCQCSNFWPLKTWLWSPTRLIWPLVISSCFRE
jgi:hypothetical protein